MTFRRRREFTPAVKREIYARSGGRCEIGRVPQMRDVGCGAELGPGNTYYEHVICDAIDTRPGERTAEFGAALCRTCWRLKTALYDLPTIAHTRRMGDRAKGIKPFVFNPLPGGRNDRIKKKLDGSVVDRLPHRLVTRAVSRETDTY